MVFQDFSVILLLGSQFIDIGWLGYNDTSGDAVAADPDGLIDNLSVDSVGYFSMEGNTAAGKAAGGNHKFDSNDGVTIQVKAIEALANGDSLNGVIAYIVS